LASDNQKVTEAVSTAGILAVSVGKNALEKVVQVIASGLELRYSRDDNCPLDIIIAENMRDAGDFVKERLLKNLPAYFPVEKMVGLIETSIGKMVPIMTMAELEKDPLWFMQSLTTRLYLTGKDLDARSLKSKD
jgi:mannitol-1-phosphate 5-dehydrogenase